MSSLRKFLTATAVLLVLLVPTVSFAQSANTNQDALRAEIAQLIALVSQLIQQLQLQGGTVPTTVTNTTVSATIDQSSLTTTSQNPALSGTATGLTAITISVAGDTPGGGGASVTVPVVNGRWSVSVDVAHFPTGGGLFAASPTGPLLVYGPYEVSLYNSPAGGENNLLVRKELYVNAVSISTPTTASATIDQGSLTQSSNANIVITGQSSNAPQGVTVILVPATFGYSDYVTVYGSFGKDGVYLGNGPVMNGGLWSKSFSYVNTGSYRVLVYDNVSKTLLSTGALTVGSSVSAQASVTVDQGSLTATAGNSIVVTGTANLNQVVVVILSSSGALVFDDVAGVSSGRWSETLPQLSGGSYTVKVSANSPGAAILATGTLTVNAPAPTCTISGRVGIDAMNQSGFILSWTTTNAASASLHGGVLMTGVPVSGSSQNTSLTVFAPTTYTLTVTSTSGATASCSTTYAGAQASASSTSNLASALAAAQSAATALAAQARVLLGN